ncbi:MAG: lipid-A-disaccharide synthase [Bacteroidota bacterium]
MKYYLIAGEKSGDLHAARLMRALKTYDTDAQFRGWGGEKMEAVGIELVKHYRETAFMGFVEVIRNLGKLRKLMRLCKDDLLANRPDVLILVDYPGFNLRMAKFAHQNGIRTFYYISPKIWAWNQKRAHKIKKYVNRMFSILPFEEQFYQQYDYKVDYVGNPLYDMVQEFKPAEDFPEFSKPVVALLPGSRKMEVTKVLPVMLAARKNFPAYEFVIAGVRNLPESLYEPAKAEGVPIVWEQTYDLLAKSAAALVTSGTATLETAFFRVPQVVAYKANALTIWIGRQVIKVKYISLVNLILDKPAIRELIQQDLTAESLTAELSRILSGEGRSKMLSNYDTLHDLLRTEGTAERAARLMWEDLTA